MSACQDCASVCAGVYKHYKEKYYLVLWSATHTETGETLVVYQSLYDDNRIWVRPLEMFISNVEYNGIVQPRFKKVAESHEAKQYIQSTNSTHKDLC